ncbi:hypothetical protein F5148DRAFT_86910 [Russula earlei]|uniref:Uncharacterized protein n=1 Tax=Russula earlei TaxID=71964 RepID=A0ACC0U998_9AGAM|nr:hypothetical protein F5148DRAFT_86910 [Russula earlei]
MRSVCIVSSPNLTAPRLESPLWMDPRPISSELRLVVLVSTHLGPWSMLTSLVQLFHSYLLTRASLDTPHHILILTSPTFLFFILGTLHLEASFHSGSNGLFFMIFCVEFGEIHQVLSTNPFLFGNFRRVTLSENDNNS